ncbi:hypothetical protein [Enterococcus casseliflavus]|uniref:hypothetical protein n=1 Tax=Enterococcus casseliflavus TaxID=37734 RepID=UPI003015DD4E
MKMIEKLRKLEESLKDPEALKIFISAYESYKVQVKSKQNKSKLKGVAYETKIWS